MANFDIKINIRELAGYGTVISDLKEKKAVLSMLNSFSKYIRRLYILMIKEAINSRRYRGSWEPVDEEGYIEYLGVTPEVDILSLISDSLESKKIGYNFVIRIKPDYKYPGTDLSLIKVLRAIESGTSDFNARPLLARIVQRINDNIKELWKGYLAMKGVI